MQPNLALVYLSVPCCSLSLAVPPCVRLVIHQTSTSSTTEGGHSPVLQPLQGSMHQGVPGNGTHPGRSLTLSAISMVSTVLVDSMLQPRCGLGNVKASPLLYSGIRHARLVGAAKPQSQSDDEADKRTGILY